MRWSVPALLFALVGLSISSAATAEVVESSATGFQVKETARVAAAPEKAWASMVAIDHWWSGQHTYSGKAANLRLEPRAGGCFCETLPDGGSVLHMTVAFVAPNKKLVLIGALGPLQTSGVAGSLTLQITPDGDGAKLSLVYSVGGNFPGGLNTVANGVDMVLGEQMTRLKRLIETGDAEEMKTKKD